MISATYRFHYYHHEAFILCTIARQVVSINVCFYLSVFVSSIVFFAVRCASLSLSRCLLASLFHYIIKTAIETLN